MWQIIDNAKVLANLFIDRGLRLVSGGTDNHCLLIDLRSKNVTGKDAENALVKAHITVNKNMVPFDDLSPFVTSGIRVGTPAITTRGLKEQHMYEIVDLIDEVIMNYENQEVLDLVADKVYKMMEVFPIFGYK